MRWLLPLALLIASTSVADLSARVEINSDGTVDTNFPAGDKPSGGSCPTGWTCTAIGDGTCDVSETDSDTFEITGSGSNDEGNGCYVYKTAASDTDLEIEVLVPASSAWVGTTESFTQGGAFFKEGTDPADYQTNLSWPFITSTRFKTDAGGAGEAEVQGGVAQSAPQYLRLQYDDSATSQIAWEGNNGSAWYNVGSPVSKSLTFPVIYGVFVTSHDVSSTTTIILDGIADSTTLTSTTDTGDIDNPPSGANFDVSTGTSTVDCQTIAGGPVAPGDTITLLGTARGPLRLNNCAGTSANLITVQNDTSELGPLVISHTGSGRTFECENCDYVVLDGRGKWAGAPAGACGVTVSGGEPVLGKTQCGIVLDLGSGSGPSHWVRFIGSSQGWQMRGVELDGTGSTLGIGVSANDKNETSISFRDDINVSNNYIHDIWLEGMYLGQNWFNIGNGNPQIRNIETAYNVIETVGRQGINIKAAPTGTNLAHHNWIKDTSNEKSTNAMGFNVSKVDAYNNWITESTPGTDCIAWSAGTDIDDPLVGDMEINAYGNVLHECARDGMRVGDNGTADYIFNGYNNTIVTAGGDCINTTSSVDGAGEIRDNICANTGGISSSLTETNNRVASGTAGITDQDFADAANDDFSLTGTSPAVDAGTDGAPATDIVGTVRPQGVADDQGAYEYQP